MTDFLDTLANGARYLLGYQPTTAAQPTPAQTPDHDSGLTLADLVRGKKAPKPAPAPSRPILDQLSDAYTDAASRSFVGAGVRKIASMTGMYKNPGETQEQYDARIAQAERDRRQQYAQRSANDTLFATIPAAVVGGVDPTYLYAPGATITRRIAAQAAIQGASSVGRQEIEREQGIRDNVSPTEAIQQAAMGGAFQGGAEALGAGARALAPKLSRLLGRAPKDLPEDFHEDITNPVSQRAQAILHSTPGVDGLPVDPHAPPVTRMDPEPVPPAYDPVVAQAQRERLSTLGAPPEDPRMSTAEGEPTNLTFPKNGAVKDINAYNDEGLKAKLAAAGIDPSQIASSAAEAPARSLSDLSPSELAELNAGIAKSQEPLIYDEGAQDWRDETPDEKATRHADIDAKLSASQKLDTPLAPKLAEASIDPVDPVVQQHIDAAKTADDDTLDNRVNHYTDEAEATNNPQDAAIRDAYIAEQQRRNPLEPSAPIDHDDVVDRLIKALNRSEKLQPGQQAAYTEARKAKLAAARSARVGTSGESGFHAELGALKGKLPLQDFTGVRRKFTQPEVDSLFDHIKTHPDLSQFGSIRARVGLGKLLDGKLPTPSEVALLSKVFGKDFVKAATKNRSLTAKALDAAGNLLNVPRSLMSSFDLSAPFRQGLFLAGRKEFWGAFKDMFKSFGSEKFFKGLMDDINARPTRDLMDEAGLYLADPNHSLNEREEQFMSNWAEKIPLIGKGVRASDRAYTGFLNKVRADVFDSIVHSAEQSGNDLKADPKALKDLGGFINNATGRGNLGKTMRTAGPMLNAMFFSPRLIASRVTLLNPTYYARLSPVVRQEAVRSLLHTSSIALTVLGLAAEAGLNVEKDPRSSDFGKITIGNTHYDILGGFGQYITLGARLLTDSTKSHGTVQPLGQDYGKPTALDVLTRFGESKLSPVAGFIADYLRGKTYTGEPFSVRSEAANLFTPLFLQDAAAVMKENGVAKGAAMSVPGLFGVGMNNYSGIPPAPTSIKVNHQDVPLNDDARAQYQKMVQSYVDENIKVLKKQGDWDGYTLDQRNQLTYKITQDGRKQAKKDLFEAPPAETPPPEPEPDATPKISANQPLFDGFDGLPTSIRRTKAGNERVGGVAHSDHLTGDAVDFVPPKGMSMAQLEAQAVNFFGPNTRILNEGDHVHVHIPGFHGPLFGHNGAA